MWKKCRASDVYEITMFRGTDWFLLKKWVLDLQVSPKVNAR